MNYIDWEKTVPEAFRQDALWKVEAYRLAVFAGEVGWLDVTALSADRRKWGVSDQLYRALGSVSANIAEGYSRSTGKDKAHFYEYALGSARESRDWYYKARHVPGDEVANHRIQFLTQIIRLLLKMITEKRGYAIHDPQTAYKTENQISETENRMNEVENNTEGAFDPDFVHRPIPLPPS